MKKLLLLTSLLLGTIGYIQASAIARLTESQFDNALSAYLLDIDSDETIQVIERPEHDAYGKVLANGSYSYVFFKDGVYYTFYKNGKKEFANSSVQIIPVRDFFIDQQLP